MKLKLISKSAIVMFMLAIMALSSCKKYVDIAVAPDKLTNEQTYATDLSATSAILALYSYTYTINTILNFSISGGLLSDEMQYPTAATVDLAAFQQSAVLNTNSSSENNLWAGPYQVIRETNLAISGINSSTGISAATKNQLLGEAKFFRAYMFFNMVNYFGGIPLSLNPNGLDNALLPRASVDAVYAQIIADLKDAQNLLPVTYTGTPSLKARANKWVATALLARVYLYTKDYANAEAQASQVIGSGLYTMPTLSNTFINTSSETILQIPTLLGYSVLGANYRSSTSAENVAPPTFVLYPTFTKSFETGDNRKTSWVDSTTYNGVKYYRINKYKLSVATAGNEASVVLRLGEQYLIRAEARAQQNNLSGAQSDINLIRTRAGLAGTTAATQAALLTAVAKERKLELFGEFGHRWFDLKRTGQADAVLAPLKATWKSTAVLMPIPYNQILLNTNLTQNPGY